MPLREQFKGLGITITQNNDVLRYVAKLPVPRSERIRLLRQWEREERSLFDPRLLALAIDGIPPTE